MTSNPRWKKRVREYAAAHGIGYQQAHDALTAQVRAGGGVEQGWTANTLEWTQIGAGRHRIEFTDHGIGGTEVEPIEIDVRDPSHLGKRLGELVMRHGWTGFWIELSGLAGRVRLDIDPPHEQTIAEFVVIPTGEQADEDLVELPRSFSHDMYDLIDAVQTRFDCTVDAFTFVRGARGGDVEYVGLIYRAGTQMYHLLHIADHDGGWEYTLSGGWPLAREEEAVEAFQAKVTEHIHA